MTRQQALRRGVAALTVASLVVSTQLALTGPAAAGGYRHHGSSYTYSYGGYKPYYGSDYRYPHGYRRGHRGHRYSHNRHGGVGFGYRGHGSDGALVAGALGAGLLFGYLLARPQSRAPDYFYSRSAQRFTPSPVFGSTERARRGCKPTTGSGLYQGRPATFGGTFCYDANGRGYIVPGSEYLIGYAN